eukprot:109045_1
MANLPNFPQLHKKLEESFLVNVGHLQIKIDRYVSSVYRIREMVYYQMLLSYRTQKEKLIKAECDLLIKSMRSRVQSDTALSPYSPSGPESTIDPPSIDQLPAIPCVRSTTQRIATVQIKLDETISTNYIIYIQVKPVRFAN